MAFKCLYCFDNCEKDNLKFCHLPLDKYTINWYKKIGKEDYVNSLKQKIFLDQGLAFTLVLEHKISIPILYLSKHINTNKKEYYDFLNIFLY